MCKRVLAVISGIEAGAIIPENFGCFLLINFLLFIQRGATLIVRLDLVAFCRVINNSPIKLCSN